MLCGVDVVKLLFQIFCYRPVSDVSLDQSLGNIGSLDGDIFLHQRISNVFLDIVNLSCKLLLLTLQLFQLVQFELNSVVDITLLDV